MDDLDLPVPDACARCQKERAAHLVGWADGGPRHAFVEHEPRPRPERIVPAHIQTEWMCSHCGAECDVWGAAEAWMECGECGKQSYLVPFMNSPEPDGSGSEVDSEA